MSEPFVLLVCGGRRFDDSALLYAALDRVLAKHPITLLIHGGATGADAMGGVWAGERNIPCRVYSAQWKAFGNKAGPIRNQQMLDAGKPNAAVAFPGGSGTRDMVQRCRTAGVPVWSP